MQKQDILVIMLICIMLNYSCRGTPKLKQNEVTMIMKLGYQFETVYAAKADLFRSSRTTAHLPERTRRLLIAPFSDLIGGLEGNPHTKLINLLSGKEVSSVIVGAKRFRAPQGFGAIIADECFVISLHPGHSIDFQQYLSEERATEMGGRLVWSWMVKLGAALEDERFYLTQFDREHILVANNIQEMNLCLEQLLSEAPPLRFDNEDILTSCIDQVSSGNWVAWGFRNYRHLTVGENTEPDASVIGSGGRGICFIQQAQAEACVRYYSTSPNDKTPETLTARCGLPRFKYREKGTWETAIVLSENEQSWQYLYAAVAILGFGVYV